MYRLLLTNIFNSFRRELKRMIGRPIYLFSSVFVMLFCYVFFLTFLNEGMPHSLPTGVVDLDRSSVSRAFIRNLDATPQTKIVHHYCNYSEARDAMQSGNIYGFLVIKHDFEKEVMSNRRPVLTFYGNDAYLLAGSLSLKDMTYISELSSGNIQKKYLEARGIVNKKQIIGVVQPIAIDSHLIANPWANYGIYLLNMLLPGVLQLMILMLTIFSLGSELKERTSLEWLKNSNNSMFAALTGKLLPYTILFSILGIGGNFILFQYMHFPMNGSLAWMCLATFLYVLAHQAIGVFFIGLFPVLRDGISIGGFYGLFAFSFAGFTFPIEGMPYGVRIFSNLFPIRHYFYIYVNQAMNGISIRYSAIYFAAISVFLVLPLFVYNRLEKAAIHLNYPSK